MSNKAYSILGNELELDLVVSVVIFCVQLNAFGLIREVIRRIADNI
jgi:hypothetical protein